ncbi:unnamed protein product [Thelazia callipaeda]|uniref:Ovule protein n=1 Tax=Thelazia callipaeda TaxID=103827 RepID=A0A0N5CNI1_THECL|nr:unnamed protein product [Thelazia callipaeda]
MPKIAITVIVIVKERAITGVRLNGIGPLIAASPTPHNDPNLIGIQPVDIHQFSQNPTIWSGIESVDGQPRGLHMHPQHIPLPPTLHHPLPYAQIMPPPPPPHYTDLATDMHNGYANMMNINAANNSHYTVNMNTDLEFSPQVNASELSSPSCSE